MKLPARTEAPYTSRANRALEPDSRSSCLSPDRQLAIQVAKAAVSEREAEPNPVLLEVIGRRSEVHAVLATTRRGRLQARCHLIRSIPVDDEKGGDGATVYGRIFVWITDRAVTVSY